MDISHSLQQQQLQETRGTNDKNTDKLNTAQHHKGHGTHFYSNQTTT